MSSHTPRVLSPVPFAQLALQNLAIGVLRQFVQKLDTRRFLVRREPATAVLDELGLAHGHVLLAVRNVEVAVLIQETDITRVMPAVAQSLSGGLGVVPVALHDQVTADHDLPML